MNENVRVYGVDELSSPLPEYEGRVINLPSRQQQRRSSGGKNRRQQEPEPEPTHVYTLLDDTDVENAPEIKFLDEDRMLPEKGMSLIYGDYASAKTFLALHKAYEISLAKDAYVVYIAAEGKHGLGQRIRALKQHMGITGPTKVKVIDVPVLFMNNSGEVPAMIRTLRTLPSPPVLIVVDTLARCMIGGDENSTMDMNTFVENVDTVRREFDSMAAIIVHHKPKNAQTSRGSVALPAACERAIEVKKKDMDITVHCDKTKDAADFQDMFFTLTPIEHTPSCVLIKCDADPAPLDELQKKSKISKEQVLDFLPDTGLRNGDWLEACVEGGMKRGTAKVAIPVTKVEGKTRLVNGIYVPVIDPNKDQCRKCSSTQWLTYPPTEGYVCAVCHQDKVLEGIIPAPIVHPLSQQ